MRTSSQRSLRLQTCKRRQHKERVLNCLQSIGGERSSAGRASVCGTEGRGFKPRRSPQAFLAVSQQLLVPAIALVSIGLTYRGCIDILAAPMFENSSDFG